jgi:hypothetical protein
MRMTTTALASSRTKRHAAQVAALACVLGGAVVVSNACVIADPPSDLPTLPETRPTIVRASVVPSASSIIGTWPDRFIVPVEMSDPRAPLFYASFIDYNANSGQGLAGIPGESDYESATTQGRVRLLEIPIDPPSLDSCHVVEIVVALHKNTNDSRSAHTPPDPGGDIVSWFFSPSGDLAGCPVLDAGLSPLPDASTDASDASFDASDGSAGVDGAVE